jgi:hypothetical protein
MTEETEPQARSTSFLVRKRRQRLSRRSSLEPWESGLVAEYHPDFPFLLRRGP